MKSRCFRTPAIRPYIYCQNNVIAGPTAASQCFRRIVQLSSALVHSTSRWKVPSTPNRLPLNVSVWFRLFLTQVNTRSKGANSSHSDPVLPDMNAACCQQTLKWSPTFSHRSGSTSCQVTCLSCLAA